ncbi:MAG TPA: DUF1080 domain-containing protein [Vicinamibacterales bacterium]
MRFATRLALVSALVAAVTVGAAADTKDFLGRWNLTGTGEDSSAVFWLEVTEGAGGLSGRFLNRGGSPMPLASVKVEGDELVFTTAGANNRPGQTHRATFKDGKLHGSVSFNGRTLNWVGVRPPKWPAADANAAHTFGTPVELVDGKSLDAWTVQRPDRPMGWKVEDGAITNEAKANNLVSKQTFKDFRIQAEYKLDKGSNSGIYLRGRYELQILDDMGKPPEEHGHMAIYAWVAPKVNASKPAGEWQTMEATLVGNRVTVTLNGQRVHDNAEIQAITGGALDANEEAPGPIMLQGDHGKVWFRKVTVTPIVKSGS